MGEAEDVAPAARALLDRVARNELRREALELLSAVGDPAARRALGHLELVLTPPPAPSPLEELPPGSSDGWLEWAASLASFERRASAITALAIAREVRPILDREPPSTRAQLVGLHTGPGGAVLLDDALARRLSPLGGAADRVMEGVERFLSEPSAARASDVDSAWPELLSTRAKVELIAELAEIPWPAVWAMRWLVATVVGPARDAPAAVAYVATYAQLALASRDPIARAAREVLTRELLER